MNIRSLFTSILLLSVVLGKAINLKVRVLANKETEEVLLSNFTGEYYIYSDSLQIKNINYLLPYSVKAFNDSVLLLEGTDTIGLFKSISFKAAAIRQCGLKIKVSSLNIVKNFDGNFILHTAGKNLILLNELDIDDYIPGVILSEVGKGKPYEFYKVKAIICRTYALSNLRKHETEGYNLCDQVHCQVYFGKTTYENILKSTIETHNLVLVDSSAHFANASFFSNCGGQTCNSEDVWIKPAPYLKSINDHYCKGKTSYSWEKKIEEEKWLSYFEQKFKLNTSDPGIKNSLESFSQSARKVYLIESPKLIPLKTIREDWKLRSTFFEINKEGNLIVLTGKGFGHGVGLCQEGAMEMAAQGIDARSIITFYYKNVVLIDIEKIDFFNSD